MSNQAPSLAVSQEITLSERCFHRLADLITAELGIKMPISKLPMLRSRLQRRLRSLGLDSFEAYCERILSPTGSAERTLFLDAVTTNKTDFFREPPHFDYLLNVALPALDPRPVHPWKTKGWCAGCSSGEESYTLAMVLSEFAERRARFDFEILATDICTSVLEEAQTAIYDASRIEPVSATLRKKHLLRSREPNSDLIRIAPPLRAKVRFERLNFMATNYGLPEVFDFIFFRNVAIYFERDTQEAVAQKLCRALRPGGFLFIGHSESLHGFDVPVRMVASAVYQKAK